MPLFGIIYTFKFITPLYSSKVTLVLVSVQNNESKNSTITSSDITINSKLISTYKELIKSDNVLKDVIHNLGIKEDVRTLKNNISVYSVSGTELIEITVDNKDKEMSCKIANEISKVFTQKVKELYNIDNIHIINFASIPLEPSNINHKKDILIFAFFGVLVSSIYIFIIDLMDTTIKSSENIEEEFGIPVLASIPTVRN